MRRRASRASHIGRRDRLSLATRPLKVGQFFTMDVITCRASGTVETIIVDAQMPAHGHGMNYRPTATQAAPPVSRSPA
jgi:hypothetical protein